MFIFAEKFLREYFLRVIKIAKTRTRKNLVPPGSCDFVGAFVRVYYRNASNRLWRQRSRVVRAEVTGSSPALTTKQELFLGGP